VTELEAVNDMLLMIKEAPVASLDETTSFSEALLARQVLTRTRQDILLDGWEFNVETRTLPIDINSKIPLPDKTIYAVATSSQLNVIQSGLFLYDVKNNTYIFSQAVETELLKDFDFSELPSPFQIYITKVASKAFEKRMRGAASVNNWIDEEITRTKSRCAYLEIKSDKPRMFQNYRQFSLLNKFSNPIGGL